MWTRAGGKVSGWPVTMKADLVAYFFGIQDGAEDLGEEAEPIGSGEGSRWLKRPR